MGVQHQSLITTLSLGIYACLDTIELTQTIDSMILNIGRTPDNIH